MTFTTANPDGLLNNVTLDVARNAGRIHASEKGGRNIRKSYERGGRPDLADAYQQGWNEAKAQK